MLWWCLCGCKSADAPKADAKRHYRKGDLGVQGCQFYAKYHEDLKNDEKII